MAAGLLVGGILGGVGSGIAAADAKKQQARFRRRQRKAIQSARDFAGGTTVSTNQGFFGDRGFTFAGQAPAGPQVSGGLGLESDPDFGGGGAQFAADGSRTFLPGQTIENADLERGLPEGLATFLDPATGERKVGGRVDEILADPLLRSARSFLQETFDNAADSPLALDFAKGIRGASAARGTFFGGASISAEAGGLSAFAQRLRQDLLPSALQFGSLSEQLRQSVTGFEAGLRTSAATGGAGLGDASNFNAPGVLSSVLSGAASGGAAGFTLDREFQFSEGFGGSSVAERRAAAGSTRSQIGDVSVIGDQLSQAIARLNRGR